MSTIIDILGLIPKLFAWIKSRSNNKLSKTELDILRNAAASNGEVHFYTTDQAGRFIRAGRKTYIDSDDEKKIKQLIALEAARKLLERGFLVPYEGIIYKLSQNGYKKAGVKIKAK